MTESEMPVVEFYSPVLKQYPEHVYRLLVELLNQRSPQAFDLEAAIMKAAEAVALKEGGP